MLSDLEIKIVKELQAGLPLVEKPYEEIARRVGVSEDKLIEIIKEMKKKGIIRRFGAALRHQDLGFTANAMVVWDVPEERAPEIGKIMAGFEQVTHCYQRPRRPGWPYNIFTVIHGQNRKDCELIAAMLAEKTGIYKYRLLYSTRELKKSSMMYFLD